MKHKIIEKSKKALLEAIQRVKEKEHEAKKTKHKILQKQLQNIEEAD